VGLAVVDAVRLHDQLNERIGKQLLDDYRDCALGIVAHPPPAFERKARF
jgi:hypothetical protein